MSGDNAPRTEPIRGGDSRRTGNIFRAGPAFRRAAGLAALAALLLLAQCKLGPEPAERRERYVTVRLNDSLGKYSKVRVQLLADGDTSEAVSVLWDGKLDAPGAIPSYRLDDGESRTLSIRVRAWDADGRLTLDETLSRVDGKILVTAIRIPQPSPRLASLSVSSGSLTPPFQPSVHAYAVSLPHSQSSLNVTAAPEYAPARMYAGISAIEPGRASDAIPLDTGANRITLTIVAADTSDRYVITATRAAPPPDTAKPDPIDTGKVDPPDTTGPRVDTAFAAWKHKGAVILRLPSAVSGSPSLAEDFPLLLRLTAADFDFAEAADSGRDLRFVDSGGRLLDYAVARWDAQAKRAEIYIRCDTLSADRDAPAILMYWGNAAAPSVANPAAVFSASRGWTGAWHLEESGTGRTGEYRDATGAHHGTAAGGHPAPADGPVGGGQDFNGRGSQGWITLPNGFDPGRGRFSLNLWIYREGPDAAYLFIKSQADLAAQRFELDLNQGGGSIAVGSKGVRVTAGLTVAQGAWTLLGIVCDGAEARVYANGVLKDTRPLVLGGDASGNVIVGARNPNGDVGFTGRMDELWSYAGVRDAWYMRLLYENQKPGSTLADLSRL